MTNTVGTKLLSVDDNQFNLMIIEEMLKGHFTIRNANSGIDAMRIILQWRPDVVLLDVMMPEMSGLEVCREINLLPAKWRPKVILVSAKAMPEEQDLGRRLGGDYLTKPFDETELFGALRRVGFGDVCCS